MPKNNTLKGKITVDSEITILRQEKITVKHLDENGFDDGVRRYSWGELEKEAIIKNITTPPKCKECGRPL